MTVSLGIRNTDASNPSRRTPASTCSSAPRVASSIPLAVSWIATDRHVLHFARPPRPRVTGPEPDLTHDIDRRRMVRVCLHLVRSYCPRVGTRPTSPRCRTALPRSPAPARGSGSGSRRTRPRSALTTPSAPSRPATRGQLVVQAAQHLPAEVDIAHLPIRRVHRALGIPLPCRGGPIIAPTTTPTISQSSVRSSITIGRCSGLLLHGFSSTRSSAGR